MRNVQAGLTCPKCGAPITTEVCQYCGTVTGISAEQANMEYPILDCKEVNFGFFSFAFPAIFGVGFTIAGVIALLLGIFIANVNEEISAIMLITSVIMALPFLLIGIVALCFTFRPIIKYFHIKNKGREISATVYGYIDDNFYINGRPAQTVKLLVNTDKGKRFLLYQLHDIKQPYAINSTIDLLVADNVFMINKKKDNVVIY